MAGRPYRVSALHDAQRALGARFTDDGDWRIADVYTRPAEEASRARSGVGLADTSASGKLSVRGEAVDALVAKLGGAAPVPAGAATRLVVNGAAVLTCRLATDELVVLTTVTDTAAVAEVLARAAGGAGCAHLTDLTSGLAALDLIGPRAPALLAKLSPLDLAPVRPLGVIQGELARAHAILIRLDRPPGPAFRALVAREHGAFVWETLVAAGHDLELVPVGAAARALLDQETS